MGMINVDQRAAFIGIWIEEVEGEPRICLAPWTQHLRSDAWGVACVDVSVRKANGGGNVSGGASDLGGCLIVFLCSYCTFSSSRSRQKQREEDALYLALIADSS